MKNLVWDYLGKVEARRSVQGHPQLSNEFDYMRIKSINYNVYNNSLRP